MFDGRWLISFGYNAHIKPCDDGTCVEVPPVDACHDRVKNGDETDVDCGGGCRSCKAGERCTGAADCESNVCDATFCRAPSCTDGVRDGFETDVDCGGPCGGCALGARCWSHGDCASMQCGECSGLGCILRPHDTCRAAPG